MNITDLDYLNLFLEYFISNSLKNILNKNIDIIKFPLNKDKKENKSIIELSKNNLDDFLTKYFNNKKMYAILLRTLKNIEYKFIKEQINKKELSSEFISFSKSYSESSFNLSTITNITVLTPFYHYVKNMEHLLENSSYIKELSNGQFIIDGKKCITLYDQSFIYKDKYEIDNDNIYEIESNNNNIKLIICSNNKNILSLIKDGQIFYSYKKIEIIEKLSISFALKVDMKLIICTNDGVYNFNKEINKLIKIGLLTRNYYGGIKINNNMIALINYETQNKESNLIFYNLNTKKVYKINEENPLNINIKSSLLSISKNNNIVLLCAYKKILNNN